MSNKKIATLADLAQVCNKYSCHCGVCPIGNLAPGVSCLGAIQRNPTVVSEHVLDILNGTHTHQTPICTECTYRVAQQVTNGVTQDGKPIVRVEHRCICADNRLITGNISTTSPTWCPKRNV